MISYLGSLVQFSSAMGRAGCCSQTSLCVGSSHRFPATLGLPRTGVSVLSPSTLLRLPAALYGAGPALSAVPVFGSSTKVRIRMRLRFVSSPASRALAHSPRMRCTFSLCGERPSQPEAWAHFPRMRHAFSLRGPSVSRHQSGLRKSLDKNRGPVCSVGGGGFSGDEFAPFPSPLLPTSSGDGPAVWSFSVPLFCEPPAVCPGWLIFPCYPTVLKKLPLTALRAFGPVLTLSNAARSSLFHPHLLVAGAGVWGTFLLGVAFRHVIWGPYLIFPPS